MLDQITWGTPGSLLCLGFFFAGLGIFLRSITSYTKTNKTSKGVYFHLKVDTFFVLGIYLIKILNKRILPFTEGFFCLVVSLKL